MDDWELLDEDDSALEAHLSEVAQAQALTRGASEEPAAGARDAEPDAEAEARIAAFTGHDGVLSSRCVLQTYAFDPFLLWGDALLLAGLDDRSSAWGSAAEAQLLPAVHAVLRFVEQLRERGARFQIMWLEESGCGWRGRSLFARRALREALAATSVEVATVQSLQHLLAVASCARPAFVGLSLRWGAAAAKGWCSNAFAQMGYSFAMACWLNGLFTQLLDLGAVGLTESGLWLPAVNTADPSNPPPTTASAKRLAAEMTREYTDVYRSPATEPRGPGQPVVGAVVPLLLAQAPSKRMSRVVAAYAALGDVHASLAVAERSVRLECDDASCATAYLEPFMELLEPVLLQLDVERHCVAGLCDAIDMRLLHVVLHELADTAVYAAPRGIQPVQVTIANPLLQEEEDDEGGGGGGGGTRRRAELPPDTHTHSTRRIVVDHRETLDPDADLYEQIQEVEDAIFGRSHYDDDDAERRMARRQQSLVGGLRPTAIFVGDTDEEARAPTGFEEEEFLAEGLLDKLLAARCFADAQQRDAAMQRRLNQLPPFDWIPIYLLRATMRVLTLAVDAYADSVPQPVDLDFDVQPHSGRYTDPQTQQVAERAAVVVSQAVKAMDVLSDPRLFGAEAESAAAVVVEALGAVGFGEDGRRWQERRSSSAAAPDPESGARRGHVPRVKFPDIDICEFQLRFAGPMLPRPAGEFDMRVAFRPDAWQRVLLDVVDDGQSALVVQPTSAGKSFVAYHAIKKTLRADNDGVVVYCCPTKALCRSVVAEIEAMFTKSYPAGCHVQRVGGLFSKDDRFPSDPTTVQVLVTVPECLSIFLNSATSAPWVRRTRYVILDEVHKMASPDGHTWEELILTSDAPVLALSATIGDAEAFHGWLEHVRGEGRVVFVPPGDSQNREDTLPANLAVERYNDLEPLAFRSGGGGCLQALHPTGAMQVSQLAETASNVHLCPEHVARLWEALRSGDVYCQTPAMFFAATSPRVSLAHAQRYGRYLLGKLAALPHDEAEAVLRPLRMVHEVDVLLQGQQLLDEEPIDEPPHPDRDDYEGALLLECLDTVRRQCLLPCVVFHFYKNGCDRLRDEVSELLLQHHVALTPPGEPALSKADLRVLFGDMFVNNEVNDRVIAGFLVGVGVHHAGLTGPQREATESLFRRRRIGVVLSTGTLAQGINMPARSVVFFKDSQWLTAITHKQSAGRAGRRGFDQRGYVIHCQIRPQRVEALLRSSSPPLVGHVLIKPAYVLRQLQCYHRLGRGQEDDAARVRRGFRNLAFKSYQAFRRPELLESNARHVQFSLYCLLRTGLIDGDTVPQPLAGLLAHLHWHQAGALALIKLLRATDCRVPTHEHAFRLVVALFHASLACPQNRGFVPREYLQEEHARAVQRTQGQLLEDVMRFYSAAPAAPGGAVLPGTSVSFGSRGERGPVADRIRRHAQPLAFRCPFTALRGDGDCELLETARVDLIVASARPELRLHSSHVPALAGLDQHFSDCVPYFLEARQRGYRNDALMATAQHCREKPGDVEQQLRDFYDVIRAVSCSLRVWYEDMHLSSAAASAHVLDKTRSLARVFEEATNDFRLAYKKQMPLRNLKR